jgi:pimeloyl-ACP methyl ester carboxylesterase
MKAGPVLVALPGTLCPPGVFEPLAAALEPDLRVDPVSWLTWPGPWDIPALAGRLADHIEATWGGPVLVCGHSTGGAIALQLAARYPRSVSGLVPLAAGRGIPAGRHRAHPGLGGARGGGGGRTRCAGPGRGYAVSH